MRNGNRRLGRGLAGVVVPLALFVIGAVFWAKQNLNQQAAPPAACATANTWLIAIRDQRGHWTHGAHQGTYAEAPDSDVPEKSIKFAGANGPRWTYQPPAKPDGVILRYQLNYQVFTSHYPGAQKMPLLPKDAQVLRVWVCART